MTNGTSRVRAPASIFIASAGLFFLYFFGLTRTGLIGPDEPRYAAIGRAMAATGDWITPRLWGAPWFEKPALLFWMTGAGFKAGLGVDLAPRLPVAMVSVAFLVYFFVVLRREFGLSAAWYSTAILATSAGWLAYSHIAITDLPMSAAFAAAMLELLPEPAPSRSRFRSGVLLGLAVLAKGLVPLALFIPALWFLRHRIRDLALVFAAAAVVATPWYLLVTLRNGKPFLEEFFWKHHFGRFLNSALQHGQPVWFYVPVLLAALFPWTPLVGVLFKRQLYRDQRALFLLVWFAWGFLFFSASRNKLPGYLLPLLPPLAALIGLALASGARARILLALSGALLCVAPALAGMLPLALESGLSRASFHLAWPWIVAGLAMATLSALTNRGFAVAMVALLATVAVAGLVWRVYPELDRGLSGREAGAITCLPPTNRSQRYSIDYYRDRDLPDCH
jgi:4-amino-4-deoxy-L-arabinose transferase-like glycosyltransferase